MHEYMLASNLVHKIEDIAREQRANKVTLVRIRLGALSSISADHFREHFEIAARGTIVEGAKLDLEVHTDIDDLLAQEVLLDIVEVENVAQESGHELPVEPP